MTLANHRHQHLLSNPLLNLTLTCCSKALMNIYHIVQAQATLPIPCTWCLSIYNFNSLTPGWWGSFSKCIKSEHKQRIKVVNTSCEIAFTRMPQIAYDDESTLFQVMIWCGLATSHYLSQCWPRSMSPYGGTGLQRLTLKVDRYLARYCRSLWII